MKLPLQRLTRFVGDEIERARRRQDLAPAEPVVDETAEADEQRRAPRLVERHDEAERPDEVRRHAQQYFAFGERGAHQAQGALLEIAQPAMDELRGRRRGAGGKVALLDQQHFEAAAGRIARNADAVDAAADDGEIEFDH